jgi:hypothetical protein
MNIGIAGVAEVDGIWPSISERIQNGCDRTGGASSSGDLWKQCRSGEAYLIIGFNDGIKVASVWRFESWPSGLVFRCLSLAGTEMATWVIPFATFIQEQARIGGSTRLIAQGRKGWERVISRMYSQSKVLWQTYEVKINAR